MFASYSVKKPYTVIVGVILVIVLGVISFMNMSTDLLPAMELPYVVVYTTYPGATPERVETELTRPMEASMATVGNVKEITSTSSDNVAAVIMEFNAGTNMDTALIEISSRLDQLAGGWPDEVGSPVVMKINPDMLPVSVVSVSKEGMDILALSDYVEDVIVPEYESIAGVASASASGLIEQEVSVTIDPARIDVLNSAILREIDGQLADVEDQLTEAQAALSDGKRELARQRENVLGQIDSGIAQIDAGAGKLQEAIRQMKEQKQELQKNLDQVNAGLEQFDSLPELTDEQAARIQAMLEQYETLKAQRGELQERLDRLMESGETVASGLQKERADALNQRSGLLAERERYQAYIDDLRGQDPEALAADIEALEGRVAEEEASAGEKRLALGGLKDEQRALEARAGSLREQLGDAGPESTTTPAATQNTEETAAPEITDAPERTEGPDASEAPAATEGTQATAAPGATQAAETPGITEAPAETDAPQETDAAPETQTPTETEAAPETQTPTETEAAPETQTPAATETASDGAAWLRRSASAEAATEAELRAELERTEAELAEKKKAVDAAQAELDALEASLAADRETLSGKKQALEALTDGLTEEERAARIAEAQQQIDSINSRVEQLDASIALLDAGIAQAQQMDDNELKRTLSESLANAEQAIAQIESSELYQAVRLMSDKEGRQAQYLQLQEAKAQLTAGIALIDEALGKLERGIVPGGYLPGIDEDMNLKSARAQLVSARAQAVAAMDEAAQQIADGEAEIAKAWKEFEDGREEAFKQANLDGVITLQMVSGVLAAQNFSMPAGYAHEDGVSTMVRVGDKIPDVESLKNLKLFSLGLDAVDDVRLLDVARVELVDNRDEVFTKVDGEDGILLSFQKQSIYSTADVAHDITARSEELMAADPELKVVELFNQGMYIDLVVDSVLQNLLYGGALAILVLLLFLLDFRPTIIIAFSIPISVVTAFVAMYFTGITLNVISLAGLALGVGMLVDNSIVVIDNIYRLHQEEGVPILHACVEGVKQVSGAIAASTLTTISVFLPIVFVQGMSRDLFTDMGLTIAYSLLASLVVSMTLVPTMSAALLKRSRTKQPRFFKALQNGYARLLRGVLKVKPLVLLLAMALLGFCAWRVMDMGLVFMPEVSSTQMTAALTGQPDDTFADSTGRALRVMDAIMEVEGIDSVGVSAGGSSLAGLRGDSGESMTFYITVKENNGRSNRAIADDIQAKADAMGVELSVQTSTMDISMLTGAGISLEITGAELPELRAIARDVAELLRGVPGTTEVDDGLAESTPELTVTVDKEKAIDNGLTVAQVYQYVAGRLYGAAEVTQLTVDGKSLAVKVADGKDQDLRPADIADMEIEATMGEETRFVRIGDIAEISNTESMSSIARKAQRRLVTVSCSVDAEHNIGLVSREIESALEDFEVPEGYTVTLTGESETINSTIHDLILMIALAVVFIFLIMVAQFQSFKSPIIVMFTIPLAFTGGLLALLLARMEISIVALLGFLVLSGVVVNNGIVFVDGVNQLRIGGMSKKEALVETGRQRLRPILMTAMTTILGMLTMALGTGMGAEMMQPMAIVTIGGLLYATLMTLFVVPSLYDLFNGEKMKAREIDMRAEELGVEAAAEAAPEPEPAPEAEAAAEPETADIAPEPEAVPVVPVAAPVEGSVETAAAAAAPEASAPTRRVRLRVHRGK